MQQMLQCAGGETTRPELNVTLRYKTNGRGDRSELNAPFVGSYVPLLRERRAAGSGGGGPNPALKRRKP